MCKALGLISFKLTDGDFAVRARIRNHEHPMFRRVGFVLYTSRALKASPSPPLAAAAPHPSARFDSLRCAQRSLENALQFGNPTLCENVGEEVVAAADPRHLVLPRH